MTSLLLQHCLLFPWHLQSLAIFVNLNVFVCLAISMTWFAFFTWHLCLHGHFKGLVCFLHLASFFSLLSFICFLSCLSSPGNFICVLRLTMSFAWRFWLFTLLGDLVPLVFLQDFVPTSSLLVFLQLYSLSFLNYFIC